MIQFVASPNMTNYGRCFEELVLRKKHILAIASLVFPKSWLFTKAEQLVA